MLKFDYCSDLHLEFDKDCFDNAVNNSTTINNRLSSLFAQQKSDTLIIAGDIISGLYAEDCLMYLEAFRKALQTLYKKVIVVAGNHDYWHNDIKNGTEYLHNYIFGDNAIILDSTNCYYDITDNVRVIGSTLWSHIEPQYYIKAMNVLNDYHNIFVDDRRLNVHDTNELHEHEKSTIFKAVDNSKDKKVIVVTHHAPTRVPNLTYNRQRLSENYLEFDIINRPQIKYWVHGHEHCRCEYSIDETVVLCNARGYNKYDANVNDFQLKSFTVS